MIYIVDIDQTICSTPVINGKNRYDLSKPYPDRIEKINKLYEEDWGSDKFYSYPFYKNVGDK